MITSNFWGTSASINTLFVKIQKICAKQIVGEGRGSLLPCCFTMQHKITKCSMNIYKVFKYSTNESPILYSIHVLYVGKMYEIYVCTHACA